MAFSIGIWYDAHNTKGGAVRVKRRRGWLIPVFLGTEGGLYTLFLILDLLGHWDWSVPVKYASIVVCLFFSLGGKRLMACAMAFTLLADTFLLLLDAHYLAGVASFCAVQILYLLRIRGWGGWPLPLWAALRGGLFAAALAISAAGGILTSLTAVSAFYFTQLLCSAAESFPLARRGRPHLLFSAGLLLFIGCDLCVGLHNLPGLLGADPTAPIFSFAAVGMWLFYLPSQVLLALSGRENALRKGGMP